MKRVFALLLVYALLFAGLPRAYAGAPADPLDDWTIRSALPTYVNLYNLACGNGVCVTAGNLIMTTPDGLQWTKKVKETGFYYFNDVAFGGGQFVVVGNGGSVMTSADGYEWTERTSNANTDFKAVAYGNGVYVAVGVKSDMGMNYGSIYRSPDGITWTQMKNEMMVSYLDLGFYNGQFIATGQLGNLRISSDGQNWQDITTGLMSIFQSVTVLGSTYVLTGYAGMGMGAWITSDPSLTSWTSQTIDTDFNVTRIEVLNNQLVALGAQGDVYTSTNGTAWTKQHSGSTMALRQAAYDGIRYYAVGDGGTIQTSTDLENWTLVYPIGVSFNLKAIATNGSNFVTVGESATIVSSADWVTFNKFNTNLGGVKDVVYGGGKFIAVGTGKDIYYSGDGNNWNASHLGDDITYMLDNVTYGDEQFIATGTAYINSELTNVLFTSHNGINWTYHNSLGPISMTSIAYGNGNYFGVGGYYNDIYKSADGINYVQVDKAGTGFSVSGVYYLNGDFFFPGNTATLAVYTNGTTLNKKPLSGISSIGAMAYDSGTYVVTNGAGDIYTTTDLESWTKRATIQPFEGILTYDMVVADGAFVMVGQKGTIATSGKLVSYTIGAIADKEGAVLNAGYASGSQEEMTITVTRTGTGNLANLAVSVDNANFEVTQPLPSLLDDTNPVATFTVKAKAGLARGNYQATVTVSAAQMTPVTFTVTQNVYAKKGDASGDGLVTPADALMITKYKQSKITLTDEQLQVLDMNDDHVVDEEDAKLILQLYVGGGVG
ncbi:dockerin type I domain-containing protein [Paenibacillus cymbidii]|uniref:dockerin type I domain-containing protein n=1 Tax=Paenibacillus cymbidii TaxID=1639034 RepID=UPI001081AA5D|nr:dockerin type I domain-containing protein [Paenibacillus cymbidii]